MCFPLTALWAIVFQNIENLYFCQFWLSSHRNCNRKIWKNSQPHVHNNQYGTYLLFRLIAAECIRHLFCFCEENLGVKWSARANLTYFLLWPYFANIHFSRDKPVNGENHFVIYFSTTTISRTLKHCRSASIETLFLQTSNDGNQILRSNTCSKSTITTVQQHSRALFWIPGPLL